MKTWINQIKFSKEYDRALELDDCYYNVPVLKEDMRFPSESRMNFQKPKILSNRRKYLGVSL